MTGSLVGSIDVAQVVLYAFWLFFALLIFYLRREDKREGYPLESPRKDIEHVWTVPAPPSPKQFIRVDGSVVQAPSGIVDSRTINAEPAEAWPGAPLVPIGDPMLAEVGPGSWAPRPDRPDAMFNGQPRIVPIRLAHGFIISPNDPDPLGMEVYGGDGDLAGTVCDVWVDRAEIVIRYLQIELAGEPTKRRVMLPMNFARVRRSRGLIDVDAIYARHFPDVPPIANEESITLLEEERIVAYYGAGTLYASAARSEPLV